MKRIPPKPGQESVWDYPRPPRLEPVSKTIRIEHGGLVLAESRGAYRVLETSHPPVYYLPQQDIRMEFLAPSRGQRTFCEWKGVAAYWDLKMEGVEIGQIAWSYPAPNPAFAPIQDFLAFYPSKPDACFVDGERVQAQKGDFYGGWITNDIVGPFKGGAGTWGW